MTWPGFEAERSLESAGGHYMTHASGGQRASGVVPQLQNQSWGSTCQRVCRCCTNTKNRFCCSHCRFCSGPIGFDGGVASF